MNFNNAPMKNASGNIPIMGAIFMSNSATKDECFAKKLFGLPQRYADFVRHVKVGMLLFLFEYEKRLLYGVFEATTNGTINIAPHAYNSSGREFPAQVQFDIIWRCRPLPEHQFRLAIQENYFKPNKFKFGLSEKQVYMLLRLFELMKKDIPRSPALITGDENFKVHKNYCEDSSLVSFDTSSPRRDTVPHSNLTFRQNLEPVVEDQFGSYAVVPGPEDPRSWKFESHDHNSSVHKELSCTCDPHDNIARTSTAFPCEVPLKCEPIGLEFERYESATTLGDYISLSSGNECQSRKTDCLENSPCRIALSPSKKRAYEMDYTDNCGKQEPTKAEDLCLPRSQHSSAEWLPQQEISDDEKLCGKFLHSKGLRSDESNQRVSVFSRLKTAAPISIEKSPAGCCSDMPGLSLHNVMRKVQLRSRLWKKMEKTPMQKFLYSPPHEKGSSLDSDSASSSKDERKPVPESASEDDNPCDDTSPNGMEESSAIDNMSRVRVVIDFECKAIENPVLNFKSRNSRRKLQCESKDDGGLGVGQPPRRRKLVRSMFSNMSSGTELSPLEDKIQVNENKAAGGAGEFLLKTNDEDCDVSSCKPSQDYNEGSLVPANKESQYLNQSIGIQVDLSDCDED